MSTVLFLLLPPTSNSGGGGGRIGYGDGIRGTDAEIGTDHGRGLKVEVKVERWLYNGKGKQSAIRIICYTYYCTSTSGF